jgi:glycosyltransferase involved in cell wall biosynthesis
MLAEHLVADRGWEVEVLTTCALDALTWEDDFPAGTSSVNGVRVSRIESEAGRDPSFHPLWARLREDPAAATVDEMERWIDLQGPRSPALLDAIVSTDANLLAFYPYLYYPTVRGLPLVADRAVMHPAAHEEPALHLGIFEELFRRCRGFVFQTRSERRLVQARFDVAATPQVLVGLGVEEKPPNEPGPVGDKFGLADSPYLICIGRVDDQKGTGMLSSFFRAYKERRPGPLRLVFVGQVVDQPELADDVVVTGMVEDSEKWDLLRGARALVSPSPFESFSLTVVEAFMAGIPVLVNAACGATREHCEQSGGGLWFLRYGEFEAALDLLFSDEAAHAAMASLGRHYAVSNYSWPVVVERYAAFLERSADR